ncbi:hypothetical protein H9P43_006323 [Blastocladiella emersonii ATCC 22665]|nr:hypothetical protein H9P43_006323 [Blastocladiella emersonii ATCC 22665]
MINSSPLSAEASTLHPLLVLAVQRGIHWPEGDSITAIEAYIERLNARTAAQAKDDGDRVVVTLHQLAPLIVISLATLARTGLPLAAFAMGEDDE